MVWSSWKTHLKREIGVEFANANHVGLSCNEWSCPVQPSLYKKNPPPRLSYNVSLYFPNRFIIMLKNEDLP